MTIKEIAAKFDGREYGAEITRDEEKFLKENGIVMMFGASDDLVELRGAINDEFDAYEGTTVYFAKGGILENECNDKDCTYFGEQLKQAKTVKAVWSDDGGYPWSFDTEIPHETFEIFEDGDKYCRGILFDIDQIGGFNFIQ
jgi:hypothetical protein